MKTYVGHREWAREVRVSPDGMVVILVVVVAGGWGSQLFFSSPSFCYCFLVRFFASKLFQ